MSTLTVSSITNLVAQVSFFARQTPPAGWLEADGSAVSRATYAALFAEIGETYGAGDGSTTFGLPDLRGEFVRGWDNGKETDTGRAFGSAQADAMQGHIHESISGYVASFATGSATRPDTRDSGINSETTGPLDDGVNGAPRIAGETRPRNIALLACIKY